MTIKAVAFDIGGVLEITQPGSLAPTWEPVLGLRPGELAQRLAGVSAAGAVGAISEPQAGQRMAEILGLDASQSRAFLADLWDEYLGTLNTELAAYFGRLRPRYRTAIISNSFVGARDREQRRYGLGDLADLIVYSHEAGVCKPDPRIYQLACRGLGVRAADMVFLDDVPEFVEAARQAGLHAVLFRDTGQAIADIQALLAG
ncbi:MAG TPA: HAD family phosphatase [Streptosporangiaceae bacterium]|nr:HAD family phosphatase [Streptosporangiaceae bacterium]